MLPPLQSTSSVNPSRAPILDFTVLIWRRGQAEAALSAGDGAECSSQPGWGHSHLNHQLTASLTQPNHRHLFAAQLWKHSANQTATEHSEPLISGES